MIPIHGTTQARFRDVRDAFAANFSDHGEVGAAVCVYVAGRCVVDLWGGIADLTTDTPWAEDTLQCVFSTIKGFTATCAHLLVQRGELDLDAPVADYWPEFAWHPMTIALAAQQPLWPPGSTHGYHAETFGWLVGEVIRRITGRTPAPSSPTTSPAPSTSTPTSACPPLTPRIG